MGYLLLGWQAFVVGFSGAMVPGPLFTLTVAETIRRRWLVGIPLIAGHAILETLLVVGLTAGLGTFLVQPAVMATIGLVGGAMLWWLGYGTVKDAWRGWPITATSEPFWPLLWPPTFRTSSRSL